VLSAATAPRPEGAPRGVVLVVRGLEVLVFVGLPVACASVLAYALLKAPALFDFRTFWQSGLDVLHGRSPYPLSLPTSATAGSFRPFVYPAPAAAVMVPFALLPWPVAAILWVGLGFTALLGSLWLLEVRDWRVYGAVFVWPAVWSAIGNGSATLLLVFACAALWKFRSRPYVAGGLVALLVIFKLYLWPLAVWLLATRRIRATLLSAATTWVAVVGGWALIGFAGLAEYPRLLDRLTALVAGESYSPYAFARSLGAGTGGARLTMIALGAVLLVAVVAAGRRHERGDELAFMLAVAASLALTPIVWPHYFALLVVVVAIASRELDAGWLLPIPAWLVSFAWSGGSPLKIGVCLALYGATIAWALRRTSGSDGRIGDFTVSILRPAIK
jgi:alpha-1,2-mannosyltransferase